MENQEKQNEEDYLSLKGKVNLKEIATLCYWLFCIGGLLTCAGLRIAQEVKKHNTNKKNAPIVQQERRMPDLRPHHAR